MNNINLNNEESKYFLNFLNRVIEPKDTYSNSSNLYISPYEHQIIINIKNQLTTIQY